MIININSVYSQISYGGLPYGFSAVESLRQPTSELVLAPPDYNKLRKEDDSVSSLGVPQRMGVLINYPVSIDNDGTWTELNSKIRIWRVNIKVENAVGLGLYFSKFHLAPGDSLFVYSEDKSHFIGSFTEKNNKKNGLFATQEVKGESIFIELVDNKLNNEESTIVVSQILVAYVPMSFVVNNPGLRKPTETSDTCEVNVKCEEGEGWTDQRQGVVRIKAKVGDNAFWCTGSIMNNTALNFAPYILTADHCAAYLEEYSSEDDISQWMFQFNFESVSCNDNTPAGPNQSMTGAVKLSGSTHLGLDGSDFLLLLLDESIPNNYNPYYQGWNANDEISENGITLHHPEGDVKKISTYTRPLEISQWQNTPGTHFQVYWDRTTNGYGVTEPGSSGSPLFNSSKLIIGTLTGGLSNCTSPNQPDMYGRLYYSWNQNGTLDSQQLQPWLDSLNTGLKVLEGSYNTKIAIAQFVADQTIVPVDSYITFTDLSSNNPDTWEWYFEGGTPLTSNSQNPGEIFYDRLGNYNVQLVVSNEFGTDSVLLENYIRVVPKVYPNPTRNKVFILFGDDEFEHKLTITNALGKIIAEYSIPSAQKEMEFSFITLPAGLYFVGIQTGDGIEYHKVLYTPN